MKITVLLTLCNLLTLHATVFSQNSITMRGNNISLKNALVMIEQEAQVKFVYRDETINNFKVSFDFEDTTVEESLNALLKGTGSTHRSLGNNLIVISPVDLLQGTAISMQGITIKGEIFDTNNQPMPGVNIVIKGTTTGVVTNISGSYTITVPSSDAVLIFSFMGYKTQEVAVGDRKTFNVTMEEDNMEIEEVTVIAYGTAKKRDLTGSITTVDSKVLSTQSNSTITRALEGVVPGLQVSSIDGQPGLDMGVRIRGIGTAGQNNSNALIVIDGVPTTQDNVLATINPKDIESVTILKDAASTALYGSRGANGVLLVTTKKGAKGKARISYDGRFGVNQMGPFRLDKINDPKDVYEYSWLSIYNAARYKPASGVKYTTNAQNPNMSHDEAALFASQHLFDYSGSTTSFSRNALGNWMLYDVPGAVYTPTGTGTNVSSTMSGAYLVGVDGKLNPDARLLYNDTFEDYFFENKFRQEHNVSVSGGTEKMDYFVSLGYLQDPSYIMGSEFERYNARANFNAQVLDWLRTGINVSYSNRMTQSMASRFGRNPGAAYANVFRWMNGTSNQLMPMWGHGQDGEYLRNEKGDKIFSSKAGLSYSPLGPTAGPVYDGTNLITLMEKDKDIRTSNDLGLRGYAEAKFLKDFTFIANISSDNYFEVRHRYWNNESGSVATALGGTLGESYQNTHKINAQQLLRWDKSIDKHQIDVLLGHEFDWYKMQRMTTKWNNSFIPEFDTYANFVGFNSTGSGNQGVFEATGGGGDKFVMESYFSRLNYVYDHKYYGELSLRGDGSSKFKKSENRWGVFWSVGAGWRISAEDFMSGAQGWLNDLKIRGDYGVSGNQNGLDYYSGYQTWSLGTSSRTYSGPSWIADNFTLAKDAYRNEDLTWEKVHIVDVGLDFRLWNRFYGTFDYYNKNTVNMIWDQPIAWSLGQATMQRNTAKMNNYGVELTLGVDIIKTKDLLWSFTVNGTHYRSIIKEVPAGMGDPAKNNCWEAGTDAWTMQNIGASPNIIYLRGEGKDYYNMYLFKYRGPHPDTGFPTFQATVTQTDLNDAANNPNDRAFDDVRGKSVGDVITTGNYSLADRYEYGSAIPKIIGGFATSVQYKGFDLSATFSFQIGGKFFSLDYGDQAYRIERIGAAISSEVKGNTWTLDNKTAKYPMQMYTGDEFGGGATIGSAMHSQLALFDASYFSVRNITFGYTLPESVMNKIGFIQSVRLYASLDNMWMFTEHSGVDPRMSLVGGYEVGAFTYPYMRSMSLGINLNF